MSDASSNNPGAARPTSSPARILAIVLPVALVGLAAYWWSTTLEARARNDMASGTIGRMFIGDPTPLNSTMAFPDADNDLVADPPSDPAKLVSPEMSVVFVRSCRLRTTRVRSLSLTARSGWHWWLVHQCSEPEHWWTSHQCHPPATSISRGGTSAPGSRRPPCPGPGRRRGRASRSASSWRDGRTGRRRGLRPDPREVGSPRPRTRAGPGVGPLGRVDQQSASTHCAGGNSSAIDGVPLVWTSM